LPSLPDLLPGLGDLNHVKRIKKERISSPWVNWQVAKEGRRAEQVLGLRNGAGFGSWRKKKDDLAVHQVSRKRAKKMLDRVRVLPDGGTSQKKQNAESEGKSAKKRRSARPSRGRIDGKKEKGHGRSVVDAKGDARARPEKCKRPFTARAFEF